MLHHGGCGVQTPLQRTCADAATVTADSFDDKLSPKRYPGREKLEPLLAPTIMPAVLGDLTFLSCETDVGIHALACGKALVIGDSPLLFCTYIPNPLCRPSRPPVLPPRKARGGAIHNQNATDPSKRPASATSPPGKG